MANVMTMPALGDYEAWARRALETRRDHLAGGLELDAGLAQYAEAVRAECVEECAREVERWGGDPSVIRQLTLVPLIALPESFGSGRPLDEEELKSVLAGIFRDVRTRQIREAIKAAEDEAHRAFRREDATQVMRWRDAEAALGELLARAQFRPDVERKEWVDAVATLADQVASWSKEKDWRVEKNLLHRIEDGLGSYEVQMLTVHTNRGTVILEPLGRLAMGADGRIDLYAYPAGFRVRLLRDRDTKKWRIRTESGVFLRDDWSRETFVRLAQELASAS